MDLINLLDGWFQYDLGEGAFYAVFGFVFVFIGITILILLFMGLGKIMESVNQRKKNKSVKAEPAVSSAAAQEEGVSPEVVAVITAAIAAYYEKEQTKCEFVVKRIRKI